MAAAVADPDPVLYYEHIALYRDPRIKQRLADDPPAPVPIGKAALRRRGDRLAMISYGAYVLASARYCSRVLIVHEDTRTGGIGESIAALIQEEAFESLDAPIRILGAIDTPVPYSPPLEDFYLPSETEIERAARLLCAY